MIKPESPPAGLMKQLSGLFLLCVLLAACSPASASDPRSSGETLPTVTLQVTAASPKPPPTLTPDRTPSPIPATPAPTGEARLCPPFPGASQADLIAAISNPFNPPPPGSDDPHQAIDLAVQQNGLALAGGPVQTVLGGRVAMVTEDRFPYGYTLLVETPLDELPETWPAGLPLPTPAPTLPPPAALTCPEVTPPVPLDETRRSLYILYAHLQEKPAFQPGDPVECGQLIGYIGQSGNALNPHLHLEVRLGPAGARFASLAHYDNTARPEEMGNYCLWRVSNLFQLVDPNLLLGQLP
jgi:murein DD-endopeptidase MepM/ murein hydrolase activator NlpD